MNRNTTRRSLALTALLAFGAVTAAPAATASAATTTITVSGTVTCAKGNKVVGLWVQSSAGGSTWSDSLQRYPDMPKAAYYRAALRISGSSTKVELHVGCGGSSSSWGSDNWTKPVTISGNRALNARCNEALGQPGGYRCSWPQKGRTATSHGMVVGQCTYGAQQKFKTATGSYMELHYWDDNGDGRQEWHSAHAYLWNDNAKKTGWLVVGVPQKRAIVVYERNIGGAGYPSSSYGHVAYVRDITVKSDGVYLTTVDMNWPTEGAYATHTVKHKAGMSYIVAPVQTG